MLNDLNVHLRLKLVSFCESKRELRRCAYTIFAYVGTILGTKRARFVVPQSARRCVVVRVYYKDAFVLYYSRKTPSSQNAIKNYK